MTKQVWTELKDFLPKKIFDSHTHVFYKNEEISPGGGVKKGEPVGINKLLEWDNSLYPGRRMEYFLIGMPLREMDIFRMADYTIEESEKYKNAYPIIVVKPGMDEKKLGRYVEERGVVGLKPYRFYSISGDIDECRITDFLPESIIEIANRHRLLIVLHLSKRLGALDDDNRRDLTYLTEKYPKIKWQLAHCARSFNPYFLEKSVGYLSQLENVYFDTSAVCESDVFDILFSYIDISRILFGSDNIPVHIKGGKYISYGHAWMFLSRASCNLNLNYCESKPVPVVYEELRALKRSIQRIFKMNDESMQNVINDIFYNNAHKLLASIL